MAVRSSGGDGAADATMVPEGRRRVPAAISTDSW